MTSCPELSRAAEIPLPSPMEEVKPVLAIDIETYSEVDFPKCGEYAYVDHPSFAMRKHR